MSSSNDLKKTLPRLSMAQSAPAMPEQQPGAFSTLTRVFGASRAADHSALVNEDTTTAIHDSVVEAAAAFLYQAGVDRYNRQILVISLASLPDPASVPYDDMLQKVLDRVAAVCGEDYVLVLMAAKGADGFVLGWRWIAKAYPKLERKYRKNLKKLYVVHPSLFIRVSLPLLLSLVSPKFPQKLVYIYTLSSLSEQIPIQQIRMGLDVLVENGRQESEGFEDFGGYSCGEREQESGTFGGSLEALIPERGAIPKVLRECATFIRSTRSIDSEGIFRRSSNLVLVRQVASAYNHDVSIHLADYHDANLPGHLIKKFLRDLKEPLISEGLFGLVKSCPLRGDEAVAFIRDKFLPALVWRERMVLSFVLHLLHNVARHSANNLMTASNLAIVTSPVLIRSADPITDALMCSIPGSGTIKALSAAGLSKGEADRSGMTIAGLLQICIERYGEVYTQDRDDWEMTEHEKGGSRTDMTRAKPGRRRSNSF